MRKNFRRFVIEIAVAVALAAAPGALLAGSGATPPASPTAVAGSNETIADSGLPTVAAPHRTDANANASLPKVAAYRSADANAEGWPRTVVDGRGDAVTLPRAPRRIISLAPSATEVIDAIGGAAQLVAVASVGDAAAERFPDAKKISVYPAPSVEAVLALQPDLVVGADITSLATAQRLRELGVPLLVLNNDGYGGILKDIACAGRATGNDAAAAALVMRLSGILVAVEREVRERTAPRPTVLLFVGDSPEYAAGKGSYSGNLLEIAGAENLAAQPGQPWPQLTREAILAMNPQVLIFVATPDAPTAAERPSLARPTEAPRPASAPVCKENPQVASAGLQKASANRSAALSANRSAALSASLAADPVWKNLAAVRNGRVYAIAPDLLNVPGPGVGEALLQLNAIIRDAAGSGGKQK